MELYTIQMAQWRKAKELGIPVVDTTVKNNPDSIFAPSWELVRGHKTKMLSNEDYTAGYLEKMRESYSKRREEWLSFLSQDRVGILCFCKAGDFCHRLLLVDILTKVAAKHKVDFVYKGEIQ